MPGPPSFFVASFVTVADYLQMWYNKYEQARRERLSKTTFLDERSKRGNNPSYTHGKNEKEQNRTQYRKNMSHFRGGIQHLWW